MAGHSKFKNIQHRKGAQDKKRAKVFTKLVREIITSAKLAGVDPALNPRLRTAISTANSYNLPKDRVERALKQASDPNDGDNYNEVRYEGFAPGGIAFIVEALTDNKNRTASDVRSCFTKSGGNLGETGSVSFMFDRLGQFIYNKDIGDIDKVMEVALEAGAEDIEEFDDIYEIYTQVEGFSGAFPGLCDAFGDPVESGIIWRPKNYIEIEDQEKLEKLNRFIDNLEESDDVQQVFSNFQ